MWFKEIVTFRQEHIIKHLSVNVLKTIIYLQRNEYQPTVD